MQVMRDPIVVDAPGKTRHSTLMMCAAVVLCQLAPGEAEARALARHVAVWAYSTREWARWWRNDMKRSADQEVSRRARDAKALLDDFSRLVDDMADVRHYLGAKRQPRHKSRPDDMAATAIIWMGLTSEAVERLFVLGPALYDALAGPRAEESILDRLGLGFDVQERIRCALPARDAHWYLAADSSADLRPYTLPAAQGGDLGRLIAQTNDIALGMDALLRVAPHVGGWAPYDWLVRSSIVMEVSSMLDLVVGLPPSARPTGRLSMLQLCRYGRAKQAGDDLERLRTSIASETREYLRWCRDKLGAHLDRNERLVHLHDHLAQLDYVGVVRLAEHVLNYLDAVGAGHLDLKLLVLGERKITSWPIDGPATGRPSDPSQRPGALADMFVSLDSPFVVATPGPLGSAIVAGITSGRRAEPREPVKVPRLPNRYVHPTPRRLHVRSGPLAGWTGRTP